MENDLNKAETEVLGVTNAYAEETKSMGVDTIVIAKVEKGDNDSYMLMSNFDIRTTDSTIFMAVAMLLNHDEVPKMVLKYVSDKLSAEAHKGVKH